MCNHHHLDHFKQNSKLKKVAYEGINNHQEFIKNMISSGKNDTEIIKYIRENTEISLVKAKEIVDHLRNTQ